MIKIMYSWLEIRILQGNDPKNSERLNTVSRWTEGSQTESPQGVF